MRKNSLRIAVSVGLFKKTSFRNFGLSCEHIKTTVSDSCGCALKPQSSRETFAWPGGWEERVCWYFQYRLALYHHIHLGHAAVLGSCLQALSGHNFIIEGFTVHNASNYLWKLRNG